jgi:hypothetical protein
MATQIFHPGELINNYILQKVSIHLKCSVGWFTATRTGPTSISCNVS